MRVFSRLLLSLVWCLSAPAVLQAQTLAWDANPETDIAGYRVSYGTQSRTYTTEVDVGNQTQYRPPQGFDWSRILYFAVRAYNTSGLISPYSTEVQWTPTATTRITSLQANVSYPVLAGRAVTWTATATNTLSSLEYKFWLYRRNAWTLLREYSPTNSATWTTSGADVGEPYSVQVWVRPIGSTAQYETFLSTPQFAVIGAPFELIANVDFPTPPGNQVTWTARVATSDTSPLEYRFLARTQSSSTWTVLRNYATSNQAQWTPTTAGTYAVQAQARRVGSTAAYEYNGIREFLEVSQTALSATDLSASPASPVPAGTQVTWTARVRGGMSGPIQYQFWIHSSATGWRVAQPYGPSETFSWTPTWGEVGDHTIQVWVRSNGSTAEYESWRSSALFRVEPALMTLTTGTLFPAAPGSLIDWRAAVSDPSAPVEYQFWVYSAATATWALGKRYSLVPSFRWIPTATGDYVIQVWARLQGSTAEYEVFRSTDLVRISQGPAQVVSLTSNVALPAAPGTTITWTAAATGGTAGPLQYQFWRYNGGRWILVQDYSSANKYTWTPTSSDVGEHSLQVWVRSAGSSVAYESYKSTGTFRIQ